MLMEYMMFYKYSIKEVEDKFYGFVEDLDLESLPQNSADEAKEALIKGLSGFIEPQYRKQKLPIPLPRHNIEEGDRVLYIPLKLQLRILLWNTMLTRRYRAADIAKLLGVSRQQVQMYVNGSSGVSVESYEKVLKLLGVYPSISLFDTETLKRVE